MQSDSGRGECQRAQNAGRYFQLYRAGGLSSVMFGGSGDAESGQMFGFLPHHRYSLWHRLYWCLSQRRDRMDSGGLGVHEIVHSGHINGRNLQVPCFEATLSWF